MNPIQIGSHLFTQDQLASAIAKTASLPPGKTGAFVASLDASGVTAQLTMKISDHIEIEGAAKYDIATKDLSGGAQLVASW